MQIRARETIDVTSVRPAASVVLVREDGTVLWVRRGDQLKFAGGFYAFPGGRVDVQDSAVTLDGGEALGAAEAPCVVAAARELFEETGVLAAPGARDVSNQERKAVREALLRRPLVRSGGPLGHASVDAHPLRRALLSGGPAAGRSCRSLARRAGRRRMDPAAGGIAAVGSGFGAAPSAGLAHPQGAGLGRRTLPGCAGSADASREGAVEAADPRARGGADRVPARADHGSAAHAHLAARHAHELPPPRRRGALGGRPGLPVA